jgi:hypothetical protein
VHIPQRGNLLSADGMTITSLMMDTTLDIYQDQLEK